MCNQNTHIKWSWIFQTLPLIGVILNPLLQLGHTSINDALRRFCNLGITSHYKNLVQFQDNTSDVHLIENTLPLAQMWPVSPGWGLGFVLSLPGQGRGGEGKTAWHSSHMVWRHLLLHMEDVCAFLGGSLQLHLEPPGLPWDSLGHLPWLTPNSYFWLDVPCLDHTCELTSFPPSQHFLLWTLWPWCPWCLASPSLWR